MNININDYVGIPFKDGGRTKQGCDCWGLLRILQKDIKQKKLPVFDVIKDKHIHNSEILRLRKDWEEVYTPQFGDGVCFKIMGLVTHLGMMINDNQFIHSWKGTASVIESINDIKWRNRVDGFFRHTS